MQDNAMRDVSERYMRFGEDRRTNSQEAGDEQSNISMNNQGFPQASTGQPSDQLRYASSDRNDDGVSAFTADEVSTTTLHESERLNNSALAQTCRSASRTHLVSEQTKGSQDSAEKRVSSHKAARHQPYFREWKWEILSVVVSFGLVIGILVTLAKYNGNEQPVWPYNININSLVSVLTALITAQLGVITSGSKSSKLFTVKHSVFKKLISGTNKCLHDARHSNQPAQVVLVQETASFAGLGSLR